MPGPHQEGGRRYRMSNLTVVDQLAAGLDARSQEGIGGTSHAQPFVLRQLQHFLGFLEMQGQWLFIVNGFAGVQGLQADTAVDVGRGQIEHHVDGGVGQQFVYAGYAGYVKHLRLGNGRFMP